jgi:hypothetical protein
MKLPSDELLGTVLGCYPNDKLFDEDNSELTLYKINQHGELVGDAIINIYELIHKMKEWALSTGVSSIWSGINQPSDNVYQNKRHQCSIQLNKGELPLYFTAPTEFEAITEACEWILKEAKDDSKNTQ